MASEMCGTKLKPIRIADLEDLDEAFGILNEQPRRKSIFVMTRTKTLYRVFADGTYRQI